MTTNLPWNELWSVYRRSPAYVQSDILRQIDLESFIKYGSKKVKAEVFADAPDELKPALSTTELMGMIFGRRK